MSGEPLCGSESPASVTVDDSVTSSASGTRAHLPVVSDGSEGSSVVVKRFRKRSLPERDPTAESLLLEHAASEVDISDASSGFVLIGPRETFLLPSPKFAVRPRSVLLQDSSGPLCRRELAPNLVDGVSRPALVRPHRSPPSCNPLPPPFFALRGLAERGEPAQPLPVPVYGSARVTRVGPLFVFPPWLQTMLLLRRSCPVVGLFLAAFFFFTSCLSYSSEPTSLQSWPYSPRFTKKDFSPLAGFGALSHAT